MIYKEQFDIFGKTFIYFFYQSEDREVHHSQVCKVARATSR